MNISDDIGVTRDSILTVIITLAITILIIMKMFIDTDDDDNISNHKDTKRMLRNY